MTAQTVSRIELAALLDDLLHACLGAIEDEVQQPYDEGCRAIAELRVSAEDRIWVDGELERIGEDFELR